MKYIAEFFRFFSAFLLTFAMAFPVFGNAPKPNTEADNQLSEAESETVLACMHLAEELGKPYLSAWQAFLDKPYKDGQIRKDVLSLENFSSTMTEAEARYHHTLVTALTLVKDAKVDCRMHPESAEEALATLNQLNTALPAAYEDLEERAAHLLSNKYKAEK